MSGRAVEPHELFERTRKEGERRLARPPLELAATAVVAGVDVVFGILALGVATALLSRRTGEGPAHVVGSVGFGIAFVFIVVGRSELFTENFLVPIAGLDRRDRRAWYKLAELWALSPVLNVLGRMALILVLTTHGVLPEHVGPAFVRLATEIDANGWLAAFMSAIGAGALITLMTWLVEGYEAQGIRIVTAWICGALLALAGLNHVIVVTVEKIFGIRYGAPLGYGDLVDNFFTAAAGNFLGGMLFVTLTRFGQARGSRQAAGGAD